MENRKGKTVWITKYALTTGIFSGVVRDTSDNDRNYIFLQDHPHAIYYVGRDAFLTEEEAKAQAVALRDKKIKSVEKQLTKLKSMEF